MDHDTPWKQICEHFFKEMLAMVLPEAHADIDWSTPIRILDKELPKLAPKHQIGRRYVDNLIEVRLNDGCREKILVHIEFQSRSDPKMPKRMYGYNYRIYDKFENIPVSLVILGDDSPSWRPCCFQFKKWGFDLSMTFPVIKFLDYHDRVDALVASTNPFAEVILAFLADLTTRDDPQQRFIAKYGLVKRLYQKKFSRRTIVNLFQFLDWTLQLPAELEKRFHYDLEVLEGGNNMPYITSIERRGIEKGREEGLQIGMEGQRLLQIENVIKLLEHRFGPLTESYQNQIQHADLTQLKHWFDHAFTVDDPSSLFV